MIAQSSAVGRYSLDGPEQTGIGIHGTNNPETIGRAGSHGCIRTANWDAAKIKDLVTVGNVVGIY